MINFFIYLGLWIFSFVVDFCILYFFGTNDVWLCSSISFIFTNLTLTMIRYQFNKDSDVIKKLIPSFENLDNHINQLHENFSNHEDKIYELESKIEELENKISDLDSRIDEIENPKSNYDY